MSLVLKMTNCSLISLLLFLSQNNEHLKAALPQLQDAWTSLINEFLRKGSIPDGWRGSTVKILYKGKDKVDDPNAYRGIALECALFKIMTKILTDPTDHHIPEQQFGFRRGRSTLHAVRCCCFVHLDLAL